MQENFYQLLHSFVAFSFRNDLHGIKGNTISGHKLSKVWKGTSVLHLVHLFPDSYQVFQIEAWGNYLTSTPEIITNPMVLWWFLGV